MPEKIWVKGYFVEGKGYTRPHKRKKTRKKSMNFRAGDKYDLLQIKKRHAYLDIIEWLDRLEENKPVKRIEKQLDKQFNDINNLSASLGVTDDPTWHDAKVFQRVGDTQTIKDMVFKELGR